jgi:nitrous oxidase accessory protein NosD
VTDQSSGQGYKGLQRAVDAVPSGGRLLVKGTCNGRTVIEKALTIRGLRTPASGEPTLDGNGQGTVLRIGPGAAVIIGELTIRDGQAPTGGGIYNAGSLTLRDVYVRGNRATEFGGGLANGMGATLTLNGSSSVRGNGATIAGGGVYNDEGGTVTLNDRGSIHDNRADKGGGVLNAGTLDGAVCAPKGDANVFDNSPDDCRTAK